MHFEELQRALEEREFDTLKSVKIKRRTKKLLDKLAGKEIDIGAVIDLALEKIKLEKLVKEMEKNTKNKQDNLEDEEKIVNDYLENRVWLILRK